MKIYTFGVLRWLVICVALTIISSSGFSSNYEDRARSHIDWAITQTSTAPKDGFWWVSAKFKRYSENGDIALRDQASAQLDLILGNFPATSGNSDVGFWMWGAMDCYLRWNSYYTQAQKDNTKMVLTRSNDWDEHNTGNKAIMSAAARVLAVQTWPSAVFASNYSSSDPTGRAFLIKICEEYIRYSVSEHNSSTYLMFHYGALRTVADYAIDSDVDKIGQKCAITAEALLASVAPFWLNGLLVSSAERCYDQYHKQTEYQSGTAMMQIYFGGLTPSNRYSDYAATTQAAVSMYRLPDIIHDVANNRSRSHTVRMKRDTFDSGFCDFYLTSYITPDYGVFSQREIWASSTRNPWYEQFARWGIKWQGGESYSTFIMRNPANNGQEYGTTLNDQVLHHEGCTLMLWDIPSTYPLQYMKAWVPPGYVAYQDASSAGRIYLHYEKVMIAIHSTTGFDWNDEYGNFTINASKGVAIIETASPSNYTGSDSQRLAAFKADVDAKFNQLSFSLNTAVSATYVSRANKLMSSTFGGNDYVDGRLIKYADWPRLDCPWIQQQASASSFALASGSANRRYAYSTNADRIAGSGFNEISGAIYADAENYDGVDARDTDDQWSFANSRSGFKGTGYVLPSGVGNSQDGFSGKRPEIVFDANISRTGTYSLWVRRWASSEATNSVFAGLDGRALSGIDNANSNFNTWKWINLGNRKLVSGIHTINLRGREAGYEVDRVALLDGSAQPSDSASESARGHAILFFEGEGGQDVSLTSPFTQWVDANASGARYAVVLAGTGSGGAIRAQFKAIRSGVYYLWIRARAPSATDDSVTVQMDAGANTDWMLPGSTDWRWTRFATTYNLNVGLHSLYIKQREDATEVDKFILTTDSDYSP